MLAVSTHSGGNGDNGDDWANAQLWVPSSVCAPARKGGEKSELAMGRSTLQHGGALTARSARGTPLWR